MGIPGLIRYVKDRYKLCVNIVGHDAVLPVYDYLLVDMNAILHNISHGQNDNVFNISFELLASRLYVELDNLITLINPQKFVYLVVDGTVPRCKLNQQRSRRYKSVNKEKVEGDIFDSNVISPGTEYMERVNEIIQYYIQHRTETHPLWKKLTVMYSSHRCPGEGEHKIIEFLQHTIQQNKFDDNLRYLIYGNDADLVVLAAMLHKRNIDVVTITNPKTEPSQFAIANVIS